MKPKLIPVVIDENQLPEYEEAEFFSTTLDESDMELGARIAQLIIEGNSAEVAVAQAKQELESA